jgi:hypothetical protein
MKLPVLLLGVLLTCAGALQAQTTLKLTTLFANNNSGSVGGTVFFDITVNNAVTITGFEMNYGIAAQTAVGVKAYTCPTSYANNEANPSVWTLQGQDNGAATAAGPGMATVITLAKPFQLAPGTYGMALEAVGSGHAYTNGNGSNQNYSDSNLALALGSATNTPFSGTPFSPRIWNGSILYQPSGSGPWASATDFGKGSVNKILPGAMDPGPFASTYTASQTRGFYFQAPTLMVINGVRVKNESNQPLQTVALYTFPSAPPAYTATYQTVAADEKLYATGVPASTIIAPTAPLVVQPGTWVGVLGATHSVGSTTLDNSYGGTAVQTTVLGQPVTLNRLIYQGVLSGRTNGLVPVSSSTGNIARVDLFVVGQPSNEVPSLTTIGLPAFGQTPKFDLKGKLPGLQFGLINVGLSRLPTSIPTPFGDLLIVPSFILQIPVANGTGQIGLPIPNDPGLTGVKLQSQALVVDLQNSLFGMTNGTEWFIAN